MNNYNKGKAKYILASMVMGLFISVTIGSTGNKVLLNRFYKTLTTDTIPVKPAKKVSSKKTDHALSLTPSRLSYLIVLKRSIRQQQ